MLGCLSLFHFEYDGDAGWEVLGSGEGSGEKPLAQALEDLRALHGGDLPAGTYRYIEARNKGARFATLKLDEEGVIVG